MSRILVVDDSSFILKMAYDILVDSHIVNGDILTTTSGKQAMEIIKNGDISVVVIDIIMPEISGIEILKWMKSEGFLENIKVIMFTSLDDSTVMSECFDLGATDYIEKPLDPKEFISRIKNALNEQDMIQKIKDMQLELMQKEQMTGISQLAAGIAHEINNPLGYIKSNINTLHSYVNTLIEGFQAKTNDEKFLIEDLGDLFNDLNNGVEKISFIVDSLRSFSYIDTFQDTDEYNINEEIEKLIILTNIETMSYAEIRTSFFASRSIEANGGELNQALLNILKNAIYAIKSKEESQGTIEIETGDIEGYGIFCIIKDDGPGIPPEALSQIFTPFYTTKPVGTGTGLGLSIAYEIVVNKHGGKLEIKSSVNQGTIVRMCLPIKKNH